MALPQDEDFQEGFAGQGCPVAFVMLQELHHLPECALSLAGKRQNGLQVMTDMEIEYMDFCICNCPSRTLPVRK